MNWQRRLDNAIDVVNRYLADHPAMTDDAIWAALNSILRRSSR